MINIRSNDVWEGGVFDAFSSYSERGLRPYQEDRSDKFNFSNFFQFCFSSVYHLIHILIKIRLGMKDCEVSLFGVYDGHGGSNCSSFIEKHLLKLVRNLIFDFLFYPSHLPPSQ